MLDLDEQDREVVDEDEGRGEAVGELYDVVVGHPPPLLAGHDLDEPQVMSRIFGSRISRVRVQSSVKTFLPGLAEILHLGEILGWAVEQFERVILKT